MRAFIYGGNQNAAQLCAESFIRNGHEVTALADSEQAAGAYSSVGADVVSGSILNLKEVEEALSKKDLAVFFGLDVSRDGSFDKEAFRRCDRIRRDGTSNVLSAVLRQRTPLFILVSSVLVYGDHREEWVDEKEPPNPPSLLVSFSDMEELLFERSEFQGLNRVLIRAGLVYSAHTWYIRELFASLKGGSPPPLAGEGAYVSPVHAQDLAEAVVCAAERAPAGSTFNIVDDEPVRVKDLITKASEILKLKKPGALPAFLLKLTVGKEPYKLLETSLRVSNARAKELLGWKPRFPSVAERLKEEFEVWKGSYG